MFGDSVISVETPKRDWQGLVRKISQGASLEDAADAMGIPIDEAITYAKEKLKTLDMASFELKLVAHESLQTGLRILKRIAEEGPRDAFQSHTDLQAAMGLTKFSIEFLKLSRSYSQEPNDKGTGKKSFSPLDLFDIAGPWKLRKPDAVI